MKWIARLRASFGAPFLFLISSIYWTQGFRSLLWMAISYQLKDGLKLSPSASQFAMTVAFIPWSMKPLYGILSDCIPIKGSRRVSYLMISGILSYVPWLLLGIFQSIRMSTICMLGLLTLQNVGTAMADVVIDAMIAEAARKERAEYIGDLQSMSWFTMALGGMFGSVIGGFVLSTIDVKGIFLAFTFFPLLQLVSCGLVDEKALISDVVEVDHEKESAKEENRERESDHEHKVENKHEGERVGKDMNLEDKYEHKLLDKDIKKKSQGSAEEEATEMISQVGEFTYGMLVHEDDQWVEVQANSTKEDLASRESNINVDKTGAITSALEDNVLFNDLGCQPRRRNFERIVEQREDGIVDLKKDTALSISSRMKGTVRILLQTIKQPAIRQPMLWFFLAQVTVPSLSTIMFYYQTNHLLLDASFLGTSRSVGWGALMLGTFLYNRYLKNMQLRRIFWWTHIALALITLFDILLVSGLSSMLAIPNKVFIVGASVLGDAVNQFKFMPFLVLSARLCEPGIEGTLFALFMSLNNLGATLSSFFGAGLASILNISSDHFENFSLGICIQALCTIFPIFFLHWIPEGTGVDVKKSD